MLIQQLSKHLASITTTIALIALVVIGSGSTANAQGGFYRGRDFGHEHQRREWENQKQHERREKEELRRHQREERYEYGDSDEIRHHQGHEWDDFKQQRREERDELRDHQHDERNDRRHNNDYSRDGRYDGCESGYYDDRGDFHSYRRMNNGYYDQFGRFHRFDRRD